MKKILYVIVIVLILSACSRTKNVDYTETPIPTTSKVFPTETKLPSIIKTSTPTPTILPSETPISTTDLQSNGSLYKIKDIQFFSPSEGWGILTLDDQEVLIFTDSSGEDWEILFPEVNQRSSLPTKYRLLPQFMSSNEVWVAVTNISPSEELDEINIWHTTDAGLSWDSIAPLKPEPSFDNFDLRAMDFISDGTGWVMLNTAYGMGQDHIAIYKTYDEGMSWEKVIDSSADDNMQTCPKYALDFYDDLHGWIIRDCFGIIETTIIDITNNGGETWSNTFLSTPNEYPDLFTSYICEFNSSFFSGLGDGYVGISCSSIDDPLHVIHLLYQNLFESTNWSYTFYPGGELTLQQNETLWCVNEGVYWSELDGEKWYDESSIPQQGKASFVDKDYGWILEKGPLGSILQHTADGGIHWDLVEVHIYNADSYE